jgi:hypothetical protein
MKLQQFGRSAVVLIGWSNAAIAKKFDVRPN